MLEEIKNLAFYHKIFKFEQFENDKEGRKNGSQKIYSLQFKFTIYSYLQYYTIF